MTIADETIKEAVRRYHREYDRYLKLCALVADICRSEVIEGNAIRAQVTSRAKSPKSLEGKLRRFSAAGKKVMPNVESVFDQIGDLAAVRIATYEQRHEDQVVQAVCERFAGPAGGSPESEHKDKNLQNPNNFYRATHIEVFLPPDDVVGTYANVANVPCEVQVCSMMAHVWNEIEHDLGYKPMAGSLSESEQASLLMLGQAVRMGDGTIANLFAETERRQKAQGGAFIDVFDFVARIRPWFPDADFGRNAGALFEQLQRLSFVAPDSILKQIGLPEPMTEAAQKAVADLSAKLVARGHVRFRLDPNSSDLLLALLLPKIGSYLASSRISAGTEGVARLLWFAERYRELASTEESQRPTDG